MPYDFEFAERNHFNEGLTFGDMAAIVGFGKPCNVPEWTDFGIYAKTYNMIMNNPNPVILPIMEKMKWNRDNFKYALAIKEELFKLGWRLNEFEIHPEQYNKCIQETFIKLPEVLVDKIQEYNKPPKRLHAEIIKILVKHKMFEQRFIRLKAFIRDENVVLTECRKWYRVISKSLKKDEISKLPNFPKMPKNTTKYDMVKVYGRIVLERGYY